MTTPPNTKPSRLTRSRDDRIIAGIGGGLAKYLGVDPVLVRLGIVALALIGGGGIVAYLIAWLIIPEEPLPAGSRPGATPHAAAPSSGKARTVVGLALIVVGIGALAEWVIPEFRHVFWPLVVVAVGGGLLYTGTKR